RCLRACRPWTYLRPRRASEPIARRAQVWGSPRAPAASTAGSTDRWRGGCTGTPNGHAAAAESGRDGLSDPVARDRPPTRGREPGSVVRAQGDEVGVGPGEGGPGG